MQRTDSPGGSAKSEKSRTESEGQARPLFLPCKGALPPPKLPFRCRKDGLPASQCKYVIYKDFADSTALTSKQIPRAKSCTFLHIDCRTLLRSKDLKALFRQWVASMSCPRPFAASLAGNDRAARAR
jgi:hypothetical protein